MRADIEAISVKTLSSHAECAIQCTLTVGCNRVNWSPSNCELLKEPKAEIMFIEDPIYKHLCKYSIYVSLNTLLTIRLSVYFPIHIDLPGYDSSPDP